MVATKKSSKLFICLFLALAFLLTLFVGTNNIFSSDAVGLDTQQSREVFQIEVLDKDSSALTPQTISYNDATGYLYSIDSAEKFKFTCNFSNLDIDPGLSTVNNKYNLSIDIQFLNDSYPDSTFQTGSILNDKVETYSNAFSTSSAVLNDLNGYSRSFSIHDGLTHVQNGEEIFFGGWGIYRFKMSINGSVEAYSDFFIIEPTKHVADPPVVIMKQTGINTYYFSLKQPHGYANIDEATMKWYVLGKGNNGKTYVLTADDIGSRNDFMNVDDKLYDSPNIKRTGLSFEFNKPEKDGQEITGTWTVWCEYTYKDATYSVASNKVEFVIGETPAPFPYVWVIVGICGLAVIITIVVAAVKAKREKIY